jgi:RHS repeat-associated protein
LNQPATTDPSLCRLTEYTYQPVSPRDDGSVRPRWPRCVIEYLKGREIKRTYYVISLGEERKIECQTPGAAWDALDNLVTVARKFTDGFFADELRSILKPDGTIELYEYGFSGGDASAAYGYVENSALVGQIEYQHAGVTRMKTTKTYDRLHRLLSIRTEPSADEPLQYSYDYNSAGQRTATALASGERWEYGYDGLGQVTRASKLDAQNKALAEGQFEYGYDDIGNRKRAKANGREEAYEANLLNQYKQTSRGGKTAQPRYDADGNLIDDGQWRYAWDGENRLVGMESAQGQSQRLEFAYDERSRRVGKSVYARAGERWLLTLDQRFVYDGWNLASVVDTAGNPVQSFLWGLDLSGTEQGASGVGGLVGTTAKDQGAHFAAFDGNGNVVGLVSSESGSSSARYEYGPFGGTTRATGPSEKLIPFRFSTKHQDAETGLLYYGYRCYDSAGGRWTSRDPLGDEAFVRGLPLWAKSRLRWNSGTDEGSFALGSSRHNLGRAAPLTSEPGPFSTPAWNVSARVPLAKEISNPYKFVHNAATAYVDHLGLAACSSCSAADIQNEAIARGYEYIYRSIQERTEYGARICCNECLSQVYSAKVVPGTSGTLNLANSQCRSGDKIVADWHTHPDASMQLAAPPQTSVDEIGLYNMRAFLGCESVGYMTNSRYDTTMLTIANNNVVEIIVVSGP